MRLLRHVLKMKVPRDGEEDKNMYDLIIIGAGPAGITASVYAARKRMNFIVIAEFLGGQTALSGDIENYTGYQFITGPELAQKFEEHIKKYGIGVRENERVIEVTKRGDEVSVKTEKGEYISRTAIIASGTRWRELGVPGEKEYKNRGVTYCVTCDGPLFSGKNVAVIGGGNSGLEAALQLIKIAKHVYLINIAPDLTGDAVLQEKVMGSDKASILNSTSVTEITGDKMAGAIKINSRGKERSIPVEGIFVEIGLIPNSEFVKGIEKNERNEIKVNSKNETDVPGIFAAGDVTDAPEKQIIVAAGEGSKAALSAFRYLAHRR
ncbi:MAG: FAD-dependent oxidoreductase [Candidatus Omnitrophota bacterium]